MSNNEKPDQPKKTNNFLDMIKDANKNKQKFNSEKNNKTNSTKLNKGFSGPRVVRRSGRGG